MCENIDSFISIPLGVMVARGLLQNPAMFAGYDYTPLQCVKDWVGAE